MALSESGRRRGGGGGLNAWPGYVDALSTLLMVIIFVLLVFVLAQGFLSVALSSRDQALDRLNRQVAELAEILALERGQAETLRATLSRTAEELRGAATARDALSAQLREAREERDRLGAERDGSRAERDRLAARIADLELAGRGGAERLATLEQQLAAAQRRAEAAGGDTAQTLQRLTETGRSLTAEQQARGRAETRGAELDRSLAESRSATEAARRDIAGLQRSLAEEQQGRTRAEARSAELDRALAESRSATEAARRDIAGLQRSLAEEQQGRTRAEARSAELDRALAESRGATEAARRDLAALQRSLAETQAARAEAERQLAALRQQAAELDRQVRVDRETIEARLSDLARLTQEVRALTALRDQLERQAREAEARAGEEQRRRQAAEAQGGEAARLGEGARAQVALLTRQIDELRAQLARVAAALQAAEVAGRDKDAQISNLGSRLNAALAARVEELQRYRSDFFGRLRAVLGERADIRVVGDRFVFQSEVLFPPASAELSERGQQQIREIAQVLKEIAARIPPDLPWVLRVDGHADRNPIRSPRFASNWELSAARAIAVAQLLINEGLPANRIAAVAFGENQPLDPADTPEAYARNRRIELRLTDR